MDHLAAAAAPLSRSSPASGSPSAHGSGGGSGSANGNGNGNGSGSGGGAAPPCGPQDNVFRHSGFSAFLVARLVAVVATQVQAVVVAWQVYDLTREPLALAYVGLAQFCPCCACCCRRAT